MQSDFKYNQQHDKKIFGGIKWFPYSKTGIAAIFKRKLINNCIDLLQGDQVVILAWNFQAKSGISG